MRKKIVSHKPTLHTEVKEKKTSEIKKFNKAPIFVILGLIAIFLIVKIVSMQTGLNKTLSVESLKSKVLPQVIAKVINNPSQKFTIGTVKEANGVYEFELELTGATAQKYTSFITKDGKILFTSGIKLDELNKTQNNTPATPAKKISCNDLPKIEKASLDAFIVADCPFGLQMQRVVKKAIEEAPALNSAIKLRYIGSVTGGKITSMHGDKEAQENLKQICIREEQADKFMPYIACYMKEGKSDDCTATSGVNKTNLDACTSDAKRGLAFAQKDFDIANKFNVSGSPSLVLNEKQIVSEFDFGGRNANSLKEIVCCGSSTKGDYCANEISKGDMATSYSLTEEASAANSGTAANCGTP